MDGRKKAYVREFEWHFLISNKDIFPIKYSQDVDELIHQIKKAVQNHHVDLRYLCEKLAEYAMTETIAKYCTDKIKGVQNQYGSQKRWKRPKDYPVLQEWDIHEENYASSIIEQINLSKQGKNKPEKGPTYGTYFSESDEDPLHQ